MKKNLPTSNALLAAIRAKCMDCSGNARSLVERCNIHSCPLYPYRSTRAVGEKEQSKEIAGQIGFFDITSAMRKPHTSDEPRNVRVMQKDVASKRC